MCSNREMLCKEEYYLHAKISEFIDSVVHAYLLQHLGFFKRIIICL